MAFERVIVSIRPTTRDMRECTSDREAEYACQVVKLRATEVFAKKPMADSIRFTNSRFPDDSSRHDMNHCLKRAFCQAFTRPDNITRHSFSTKCASFHEFNALLYSVFRPRARDAPATRKEADLFDQCMNHRRCAAICQKSTTRLITCIRSRWCDR